MLKRGDGKPHSQPLMQLILDMGNSTIVAALVQNGKVLTTKRIPTDRTKKEQHYEKKLHDFVAEHIQDDDAPLTSALSSVVPELNDIVASAAEAVTGNKTIIIDNEMVQRAIVIDVDDPTAVGKDRIADVVGALTLFPTPLIVIDMGTATTVNIVDANRHFIGGMIIPGVRTSLLALSAKASQLPEVRIKTPPSIIGKNTIHCMQSGIIYGFASMIDGIIDRLSETLPGYTVVATGGMASHIIPHCQHKIHYNQHLLIKGIDKIVNK